MRGAIHLFTIRGIEVRLDYSWFVIFILVTWSLGAHYFPSQHPEWSATLSWVLGALTSISFFASVLAHELAHSFVAQAYGTPVPRITLFIFGGASQLSEEPKSAREEFYMALVGPGTSMVIALLMGALWFWARDTSPVIASFSGWLGSINMTLAIFNLIPGFPLDGGRVLRAILWGASHDLAKATRIAVIVGRGVAYCFIFIGVFMVFKGRLFDGIWIAFIGWFLEHAATANGRQMLVQEMLSRYKARDLMVTECDYLPSDLGVDKVVNEHILRTGRRCFPVLDQGRVVGILTLHNVKHLAQEKWPLTNVKDIMTRAEDLKQVGPDEPLSKVLGILSGEDVNQVPVVDQGKFMGMISRDNILDLVHNVSELGNIGPAATKA